MPDLNSGNVCDVRRRSGGESLPRPVPPALGRGGWGGQPQVAQDPLDHRSLHECGDDLELAAAEVRAVLQGDVEDPLEQPRPADAYGPNLGGLGHALDAASGNAWRLLILGRPLWHHPRAQLRVRGEHAMESYEVQLGPWHERGQPLQELQRADHLVRGEVEVVPGWPSRNAR